MNGQGRRKGSKDNQNQTKKIKCAGVVVRIEPTILKDADKAHYNAAIFFSDISKKDQKIIDDYLAPGAESKTTTEAQVNQ